MKVSPPTQMVAEGIDIVNNLQMKKNINRSLFVMTHHNALNDIDQFQLQSVQHLVTLPN